MSQNQDDIDFIFQQWPYQPGVISARLILANDGREVLQMRIEMGLIQMEVQGRPDGEKPHGFETYLAYLADQKKDAAELVPLTEEECTDIDREFLQYYQRRICCLALREFDRAVADSDHTLALMDFVLKYSPSEDWTLSHERYRPFVHFHRCQALALITLERSGPEVCGHGMTGLEAEQSAMIERFIEGRCDAAERRELSAFLQLHPAWIRWIADRVKMARDISGAPALTGE